MRRAGHRQAILGRNSRQIPLIVGDIAGKRDRLRKAREAGFAPYALCLAPLVIHLAYIQGGRVRSFNAWGDFSYGV